MLGLGDNQTASACVGRIQLEIANTREIEVPLERASGVWLQVDALDLGCLVAFEWDAAFGDVHKQLQLEPGARCVGDKSLQTIGLSDDELVDFFLDPGAILFVSVPVVGVEKALVDQHSKLSLVGE